VLDCEPLDDAPILELRIRKGVRRHNLKLAVATARPSALDPSAHSLRFAPGAGAALAAALAGALRGESGAGATKAAQAAGTSAEEVAALAAMLREAGEEIVVLYGERLLDGGGGRSLLELAGALSLGAHEGAGLISIPDAANGRGLREAGVLPNAAPGLGDPTLPGGRDTPAIAEGLLSDDLVALYLLSVDPLRDLPDRAGWERALEHATTVIAHAAFLSDGMREHATVIFPAEAAAEKEGTVTHPDGRVQRLRPAIARQGQVRAEWSILAELAGRLGAQTEVASGAAASALLFEAVPFYSGLSLEELGGVGVRWPEREQAQALPAESGKQPPTSSRTPARAPAKKAPRGRLTAGSYRSIWAAPEVAASPALAFLHPRQRVEISPADARRLGLTDGVEMAVSDESGTQIHARVAVRTGVAPGSAFLQRALATNSAESLAAGATIEILAIPDPPPPPPPDEQPDAENIEEAYA
jgi:NADH-quinone oxidoreductase subunit G